jgi:hypothetical protein
MACSATERELASPVTASAMPRALSAPTSTASKPTPWRETILRRPPLATVAAERGCVRRISASASPIRPA